MKVGVLTSSRADFGIYLPLMEKLFDDDYFSTEIIAFGTHLSERFGKTYKEIENAGYPVIHQLDTLPDSDSPQSISQSIAKTVALFSEFWNNNKFDIVFALGDRFEMFGAVLSGTPFNIKIAHIHAGETTLGAIDNAYRHSISLMSKYLFVTTEAYKKRAIEIIHRSEDVFNVGALSIDNLTKVKLYSLKEFGGLYNIDLSIPTILTTFHPETINYQSNEKRIKELLSALKELTKTYQVVITMPNADTHGLTIRQHIVEFSKQNNSIKVIESFGMKGYLSCMKYCSMLIGNTSSAFVEASFFPKWVINVGHRQDGRIITPNIFSVPAQRKRILACVKQIEKLPLTPPISNIYGDGNSATRIINIIKSRQ